MTTGEPASRDNAGRSASDRPGGSGRAPVTATMNRDADGEPVAVTLWLGLADLEALGIDPDATDGVTYWVDDGVVHVAPRGAEVGR